jgi:hypothetical protein
MPPTGALEDDEIAILRRWIDEGADMPGRTDIEVEERRPTEPRVQAFLNTIHTHDTKGFARTLAADKSAALAVDAAGSSMLMHAAYAGSLDMMTALVDAGVDVNAKNSRRATALHWAIADPAKVRLLLLKGADVKQSGGRQRPLHLAAMLPAGARIARCCWRQGRRRRAVYHRATPPSPARRPTSKRLVCSSPRRRSERAVWASRLMTAALNGGPMSSNSCSRRAQTYHPDQTWRNRTCQCRQSWRCRLGQAVAHKAPTCNIDFNGYTPLMHATTQTMRRPH